MIRREYGQAEEIFAVCGQWEKKGGKCLSTVEGVEGREGRRVERSCLRHDVSVETRGLR